jgi:single-stranded DNA-specific DHH superfamily exonuclease
MANYSEMDLSLAGDLENYNSAKEAIVDALFREEFITEEQAETLKTKYVVVLVKGNWFGTVIGKLLSKKDTQYIKLVKIV